MVIADSNNVLLISEHDYRTARRANFHPIADALVRQGRRVTFISVRYSLLSLFTEDSRNSIEANKTEIHNGIECYLWRPLIHPFNPKKLGIPSAVTVPLYWIYPRLQNEFINNAIRSASTIIVESGLGAILLQQARRFNKNAKLIYYASDNLEMIGAHPVVQRSLIRCESVVDHVCLASRKMAPKFQWAGDRIFFVPHGINLADFSNINGNPYSERLNGVSVGSSIFDAGFFERAAPALPDVEFHVIGSGAQMKPFRNLRTYDEMSFRETLPFIKNATFGIAPYRPEAGSDTICDTSMKLMQYDYVGIPAVCPHFAAADYPNRFGYTPGDTQSIKGAILAAIAAKDKIKPSGHFLTWDDVVHRILNPESFADTRVSGRSHEKKEAQELSGEIHGLRH